MESELESKVIAIIAAVKRVSPQSVRLETTFEQLAIDSLDKINILFELESAFDIEIPDEEARSITSVGGIVERLSEHLKSRRSQGA